MIKGPGLAANIVKWMDSLVVRIHAGVLFLFFEFSLEEIPMDFQ